MSSLIKRKTQNEEKKKFISIYRIVSDFYPCQGGSITHVIELIQHVNPYIDKQILFCPAYKNTNYLIFDQDFLVPIKRIKHKFLKSDNWNKIIGFSIIFPFYYAHNIVKEILQLNKVNTTNNLIHVHNFDLGLYINLLLKIRRINIPIVIMSHGSPFPEDWGYPTIGSTIFNIFFRNPILKIIKPDYVLLLNDGVLKEKFITLIQKNSIPFNIVLHAIDTEVYAPDKDIKIKKEFVILSPHRLELIKRVDLGIISFKKLFQNLNYPENLYLKIAGSGDELLNLLELVNNMGMSKDTIFLGGLSINETINEFLSANIIIGTSLVSNMCRSIQEAMACAKPVVLFSEGNDGFFINQVNCLISKPGDIDDFANNLKLLYESESLCTYIGNNARNTIIQNRSWSSRLKMELEVYKAINEKKLK